MEQTFPDPTFFAFVHRAMTELSDHLSLPERPKRWAIIANDLSIEDGTLTPNFKIRKRSVRKQNADIIDALYGKTHTPKRVLCIGCIDGDSKEADPRFSRDCVSNSRE